MHVAEESRSKLDQHLELAGMKSKRIGFPQKRECTDTSSGVFEEKHGSERRGRDHQAPADQGSVPCVSLMGLGWEI